MKFSLLFFDFFSEVKDRLTYLLRNRYLIKARSPFPMSIPVFERGLEKEIDQ